MLEQDRIEFHIYKHFKSSPGQKSIWGATGQCFKGNGGDEEAIKEADKLSAFASEGVEYSVQRYVYSISRKNRPAKTTIWRNGILLASV
ncbi:hypothetical protein [Leptospira kmetyi]|uniref:hypothetical protein n=1 Tax=Leptospira kmetyi TaxID=408139 RepID=UPI000288C34D|nr:hypothetical protein [Leptospira kmetyi]EQA55422.1 hypothetical protein LEP1GSC052_0004 [Leptospira kmetyi serovar Malaysia str. Bejo-Iso9]